jgi:hydroxymethylpyrimidine/phosphomethylpyrimidine kinase
MSETLSPVLSIAGSDCSAGAGIQADLKTITALGGYGLTAVTAVVSETPGKLSTLALVEPELITDQIRVLLGAFPIQAAKTGMLGGAAQVAAVAKAWRTHAGATPLVVDPVMVATGGGKLLMDDAVTALVQEILPLATVITPNMDEAAVLWDRSVETHEAMEACATELAARFETAVLLKGGHLPGGEADDVLAVDGNLTWFRGERTPGVSTHGTGCTLSSALATFIARGMALPDAVTEAKQFVTMAIQRHLEWTSDLGPVHALHHAAAGSRHS